MTHGASSHRRRTPQCIHCHSKYHRSEDHHLPLTIPAMPTLPARLTPCRRDPMPGPSTQAERRPQAPNPSSRRYPRNPPRRRRRDTIALHAIDASTLAHADTPRKKDQITTDSIQETTTTSMKSPTTTCTLNVSEDCLWSNNVGES